MLISNVFFLLYSSLLDQSQAKLPNTSMNIRSDAPSISHLTNDMFFENLRNEDEKLVTFNLLINK